MFPVRRHRIRDKNQLRLTHSTPFKVRKDRDQHLPCGVCVGFVLT